MPYVQPFTRPEWEPLPHAGCHGVNHKVLAAEGNFALALLRLTLNTTIHEHPAAWPIDFYCLEGSGLFSLDGDVASIHAGECVRSPPNVAHRLWAEASTMVALMVEKPPEP